MEDITNTRECKNSHYRVGTHDYFIELFSFNAVILNASDLTICKWTSGQLWNKEEKSVMFFTVVMVQLIMQNRALKITSVVRMFYKVALPVEFGTSSVQLLHSPRCACRPQTRSRGNVILYLRQFISV